MKKDEFKQSLIESIDNVPNPYHPFVWIHGQPKFGNNVYIGGFSEINAKGAKIVIGDNCDIASFVVINVADSHKKTIGLLEAIERKDIVIGDCVFIGSHSFIGGGVQIGHHSVVGAGTIISKPVIIPPYSLVVGNPPRIIKGHYNK